MMNADENVDDLKDYAGTTCILEPSKPSHTVKACVLSIHVKFRLIKAQVEGISKLVPFTAQRATSMDNGIGDGLVGRHSMTLQDSFDKDSLDGNGE